jgi:hypothetical protein
MAGECSRSARVDVGDDWTALQVAILPILLVLESFTEMGSQSQIMMISPSPRLPSLQLIDSSQIGPGRLLAKAYVTSGRFVGRKVNRLAHQMGYGPDAVQERILKHFETREERSLRLSEIRNGTVERVLNKNCAKLMKYVLP